MLFCLQVLRILKISELPRIKAQRL